MFKGKLCKCISRACRNIAQERFKKLQTKLAHWKIQIKKYGGLLKTFAQCFHKHLSLHEDRLETPAHEPADFTAVTWSVQRDRRWRRHGERRRKDGNRGNMLERSLMGPKWSGETHTGSFFFISNPITSFTLAVFSVHGFFISHFHPWFSYKGENQKYYCGDAWHLTGEDISISIALHFRHHWVTTKPLQQSKHATWTHVRVRDVSSLTAASVPADSAGRRCAFLCQQQPPVSIPASFLLAAWWGSALQLNSFLICMCDICD